MWNEHRYLNVHLETGTRFHHFPNETSGNADKILLQIITAMLI